MKKFIHYIVVFVAAALAVSSCVEPLNNNAPKGKDISLSFTCGVLTKADDEPGAVANYENLVKRIDYFIFPVGTDGKVADDTEYKYKGTIVTTDDDKLATTYSTTISRNDANYADIFPNGNTTAVVFAIANYVNEKGSNNSMIEQGASLNPPLPNTTIPADAKTWKALHELEVGATFFYDDKNPNFSLRWPHTLNPDDSRLFFVMTGEAVVSLAATTSGDTQINGEVPLKRLASKVSVNFTYEESITDSKGIIWKPQQGANETRVYLSNAIEHTTLGGPLTRTLVGDSWGTCTIPQTHKNDNGEITRGDGTRDIFEYAYNFMNDVPEVGGKKTAHFYTYPLDFEEGDDNQPYLKLVLPWYGYQEQTNDQGQTVLVKVKQKEVYYKIVLPRNTLDEPNKVYEYSVHVNIVGSDKEVELTGYQYKVKDWLADDAITSSVAMGRYLSLDIPKNEYDMYGNKVEILFVSSGEVEISHLEISTENMTGTTPVTKYYINGGKTDYVDPYNANTPDAATPTPNPLSNWVSIQGSKLVVNHTLNPNINDDSVDISPYVFVITLHLKADENIPPKFDRTVTITQYPPMYITARTNTNYSHQSTNDAYGYVYINSQTQNHDNGNWYVVRGLAGTNKNPNMYLISTSVLGDGLNYILGDPRETNYTTWNQQFGQGRWTEDANTTSHRLTYYYPTRIDDASQKIIAPLFRVASSYGVCGNPINSDQARYRCASYQEDGYPAGRWRVPTSSEIEYIATLSAKQLIPTLFNVGDTYFSAGGAVSVNSNGTVTPSNSNSSFVRCVYDEWYWGSDRLSNIDQFTWGDRER